MPVIHPQIKPTFSRVGVTGTKFPTQEFLSGAEFLIIDTQNGHDTAIIEKACDFCYYILEGSGLFLINDQKENCGVGDLVVIPKGTPFTYKGHLKMLLTVTPPFYPEQEEVVSD